MELTTTRPVAALPPAGGDGLPLTPMQEGMLFASLHAPAGSGAYIEQAVVTLQEPCNEGAFAEAWRVVSQRHESLRLRFAWRGLTEARQYVEPSALPAIIYNDCSTRSPGDLEEYLAKFLAEDRARGVDIETAPPHRVTAFKCGPLAWRFVWTIHHAVIDGRGIATTLRELLWVYDALRQGQPLPELPAAYPFSDYARSLASRKASASLPFWRALLADLDEPCALPLPVPALASAAKPEVHVRIEASTTRALEAFALAQGVTVATLVHGAWALLLHRYTAQGLVVFGATRANRPADAGEQTRVGLYINTLPLAIRVQRGDTLGAWLQTVRAGWLAQRPHAETPLQQVQHASGLPGGTALFDTYTMYERGSLDALINKDVAGPHKRQFILHERTPSPVTLAVYHDQAIDVHIEYDPERFAHDAVKRMAGHFATLLSAMPHAAEATLGSLPMLSEEERKYLLPAAPAPVNGMPVHEAIAARATRRPNHVALRHRSDTLSYAEMDERANRWANLLQSKGVGKGTIVAFCLPRSIDAMLALLGILKAGAAYLPIEPSLPEERRAFLCTDSKAVLLIGNAGTLEGGFAALLPVLDIEAEAAALTESAATPCNVAVGPEDAAYVIYTSGSTGQPKGVVITHGALSAFVAGAQDLYALRSKDRMLQFASLSFDAAAEEIFPTLTRGATLVLRIDEMLDSATGFIEQCRVWGVTVLDLPTAFWHVIVDSLDRIPWPPSIRLVIIGGEAAHPAKVTAWRRGVSSDVRLANTYGPTETTVAVTCAFLERETEDGPVPIGRAFPHASTYVLDATLSPVPEGVPGELCIGGPQLARGYLGRDDLTDAAFVIAPWDQRTRLYRTGDRVYQREDGALVYLGRMDRQVKLRGFRIELGEIEAAMRAHPSVGEAAILLREDQPGLQKLCAYVSPAPEVVSKDIAGPVREHLSQTLPAYMQPSSITVLEALPMTPSGKVDRKALPAPQEEPGRHQARPPRNATEEQILKIWRTVFGATGIGCDDDFLTLGGHSLLAAQIIARMAEHFGRSLSLSDFLAASTVGRMAEVIDAAGGEALPPLRIGQQEVCRLSPDQEIVWVFESCYPGTPAYHIPIAFQLKGEVNEDLLKRALEEVVARHETLRSIFRIIDDVPVMEALGEVDLPWRQDVLEDYDAESLRAWLTREAVAPFDIKQGPLVRVAVLRLPNKVRVVCATVHHLVADGWSVGVIVREWSEAYASLQAGALPAWTPLPARYADYTAWAHAQTPDPGEEMDLFWRNHLSPPVPRLVWPAREADAPVEMAQGAQYPVHLSAELSESIMNLAHAQGVTPFAVLFTLFEMALQGMTGQRDGVAGFTLASRTRLEFEPLVGFFINTLLLRVNTGEAQRFDALLQRTSRDLVAAQEQQAIPFARLREISQEDPTGRPLLQALFLMQSMDLPALELDGVECRTLQVDMGKALAEVTLELYPSQDGYAGWFEYQTQCLDRVTIARLVDYLLALAECATAHPQSMLDTFPQWVDCPRPTSLAPAPPLEAPLPPPRLKAIRGAIPGEDDAPPDEMERRLLKQFERVLRTRGLTVHDNFFDHGGHSLLVILLLDRIERTFEVRLPPVRVYQAPTVRGLARFLRDSESSTMSRILHVIRNEGTRTPLFFVGSTDLVPPLLPYLTREHPIFSLNIFGLLPDTGGVPELTVAGIARAYIAEMRAAQPKGPYRLAAYCRDTMLALEIAQQLADEGETVDRLIAMDFFWESKPRYSRFVRHLMNLKNFGMAYAEEKVHEFVKMSHESYARIRARLAQRRVARNGPPLSESNRNAAFIQAYYDAVEAYEITRPYPGHVNVILVTEWGITHLPEWEDVVLGGVTVRLLKACHHNLWNPPQDQDLAATINACLSDQRE